MENRGADAAALCEVVGQSNSSVQPRFDGEWSRSAGLNWLGLLPTVHFRRFPREAFSALGFTVALQPPVSTYKFIKSKEGALTRYLISMSSSTEGMHLH